MPAARGSAPGRGGNRDEREYPDPDRFDIGRGVPTQLGFAGRPLLPRCVAGSPGTRVALEEFSARFPAIAIEEDFVEEIARIHGYEHVPFARA